MKKVMVMAVAALGLTGSLYSASAQQKEKGFTGTYRSNINKALTDAQIGLAEDATKAFKPMSIVSTEATCSQLQLILNLLVHYQPKLKETFKEDITLLAQGRDAIEKRRQDYIAAAVIKKNKAQAAALLDDIYTHQRKALLEKTIDIAKEILQKVPANVLDHLME